MGVPTQEELDKAIKEVIRMRESGEDPHFVAKVLLHHHWLIEQLEKAVKAADLYLHSGHGSREHTMLVKAIENAKNAHRESTDREPGEYGL
jgi:hypothetical protein